MYDVTAVMFELGTGSRCNAKRLVLAMRIMCYKNTSMTCRIFSRYLLIKATILLNLLHCISEIALHIPWRKPSSSAYYRNTAIPEH